MAEAVRRSSNGLALAASAAALALVACLLPALPAGQALPIMRSRDRGSGGGPALSPAPLPPAQASRSGDVDKSVPVPSYMLDLYQRYTSGLPPLDGSNAVHCILATLERAASKDAITFNLDTVASDETAVKAELRFHRRATFPRDAERTLQVSLLHARSRDSRGSGDGERAIWTEALSAAWPPLRGVSSGWQTMDVTRPIKLALSSATDGVELAFTFANATAATASGSDAEARELFLRHHTLPYVLIYANDTVNITADQISSRLRLHDGLSIRQESESLIDPETGLRDSGDRRRTPVPRLPPSPAVLQSPPASHRAHRPRGRLQPAARFARGVLDNEIPGDPDVSRRLQQQQQLGRQQPRRTQRPTVTVRGRAPVVGLNILRPRRERIRGRGNRAGAQLIPWPLNAEPPRPMERRFRGGGGGGGGYTRTAGGGGHLSAASGARKAPDQWPRPSNTVAGNSSCGRKRLTLDFDDVGWGRWIIEPKSFEIHYCSGTCEFPLSPAQQPTNHATIQSLLRAAGVRPGLPSPCCVPDKLSSVTLLYYDQKRNIVLKNYPGMTVESCACR